MARPAEAARDNAAPITSTEYARLNRQKAGKST